MSSSQNRRKILMISPFTNVSGSAIRFWNVALELERNGYNVVYVDRKVKGGSALFTSAKIKYYSCPATFSMITDILFSALFNCFIFFRHINCTIYYQLKPAPNNGPVAFLAMLFKKRILLDIDDLDFAYFPPGIKFKFYKAVFDNLTKLFPLVTYHTPNLRKYLTDTINIDVSKTYYLAQGVTETFLDKKATSQPKIPKSLIYVATLGITSDFEAVIPLFKEVCKEIPDVKISIVGDGVRRRFFEEQFATLGLQNQVTFTGRLNHHELPAFIARHEIGINYMNPTPANECRAILKIREYCACGLQVVCNRTGDAELFKNVIYIEDTLLQMQSRIISLLREPFQPNSNGVELMKTEYRWSAIVDKFLDRVNL